MSLLWRDVFIITLTEPSCECYICTYIREQISHQAAKYKKIYFYFCFVCTRLIQRSTVRKSVRCKMTFQVCGHTLLTVGNICWTSDSVALLIAVKLSGLLKLWNVVNSWHGLFAAAISSGGCQLVCSQQRDLYSLLVHSVDVLHYLFTDGEYNQFDSALTSLLLDLSDDDHSHALINLFQPFVFATFIRHLFHQHAQERYYNYFIKMS